MRILSKSTLREFWLRYPAAELPLRAWHKQVLAASWSSPNDVKALYGNASILANNRVIFNIKGNDFRLIAQVNYEFFVVRIRFIGTHAAYDHINAATI